MDDDQGWELVTYSRNKKSAKPAQRLQDGLISRDQSGLVKNVQSTVPKRYTSSRPDLKKLDAAEGGKQTMLSLKSRADMAAARMTANLTQKQLDMTCAFPYNTTNAFESGRLCPTPNHLRNIQRVLGVKLTVE